MDTPIILDDFVSKDISDVIEDLMFDCSWNFKSDNCNEYRLNNLRFFANPYKFNVSPTIIGNLKSPTNKNIFSFFEHNVIKPACEKINFNVSNIDRCLSGVHFTQRDEVKVDTAHLNKPNPHLIILYYVIDSDAETIIYNETIEDISFKKITNNSKFNVKCKITPRKGRILFFDGKHYHSSSTPSKNFMRCIIASDLYGEFKDGSSCYQIPKKKQKYLTELK